MKSVHRRTETNRIGNNSGRELWIGSGVSDFQKVCQKKKDFRKRVSITLPIQRSQPGHLLMTSYQRDHGTGKRLSNRC